MYQCFWLHRRRRRQQWQRKSSREKNTRIELHIRVETMALYPCIKQHNIEQWPVKWDEPRTKTIELHFITMAEKTIFFQDFLEIESHIRFSQNKPTTGMLHTCINMRVGKTKQKSKKEIALF